MIPLQAVNIAIAMVDTFSHVPLFIWNLYLFLNKNENLNLSKSYKNHLPGNFGKISIDNCELNSCETHEILNLWNFALSGIV